jgi:hypothetical protein
MADSNQNPQGSTNTVHPNNSAIQPAMEWAFPKPALPKPIPLRVTLPKDYVPFPLDELTPTLWNAVNAIVDKVQCPDEIAAQSVLSVASLAVQGHVDVMNPIGEVKPVSLFFLTIAKSGERKSAADKLAMVPVRERERQLEMSYNLQMEHFKKEHAAWEARRNLILRGKDVSKKEMLARLNNPDECGPEPVRPLLPNLTASEPTLEGLLTQFQHGQPSMGIFSDEGSTFIGGHGMTDETRKRTGAALINFWDGTKVDRVRKALEESFTVKNRRLSFHLMVQPNIAEEFTSMRELKGMGLFARLLITWPDSTMGERFYHEVAPETAFTLNSYSNNLLEVFKAPFNTVQGTNQQQLEPKILQLDEEATQEWITFVDWLEPKIKVGGEWESITEFANKMPEHALRIAAVMTVIENPRAASISKFMFWRAANLVNYYANQHLEIFDDSDVDEKTRNAELLFDWLQNKYTEDFISMTEIQQEGPHKLRVSKVAYETVNTLMQHNWLVIASPTAKVRNRKVRTTAWFIQR